MKEIEPVMRRFNEERHWADEKLDTARLSSVMTGAQLDKQIKVVATLTAAECVWRFDSGSTQDEDIEIINKNQVKVHTRESVKPCLYCGRKADPASYDGDFRFVYVVERIAGQWLVSSRILAETLRNERAQSTCPASP